MSPITTWSIMTEFAILTFFPMTQCAPTQDFFTEDLSSILVYSPIIESLPTWVLGATSALEGTRVIDAPCFVAYIYILHKKKGESLITPFDFILFEWITYITIQFIIACSCITTTTETSTINMNISFNGAFKTWMNRIIHK